jgi:hypothetical protein
MLANSSTRILQSLAAAFGFAAGAYLGHAAITWLCYGHSRHKTSAPEHTSLLDSFMPSYEVVERHQVRIAAPAEVVFSAATELDLMQSPVIRGIIKARELALGGRPEEEILPTALLEQMRALGWRVLAEVPGREIVMGTATRPWHAHPVFTSPPPEAFAAFHEPDYVKIVWNLRADPAGDAESVFSSETRATATDEAARSRFRLYWSFVSPGVGAIRCIAGRLVKKEAERRARPARAAAHSPLSA